MQTILVRLLTTLADLLRSRASLHLEILAVREQLAMVANRDNKRHRFRPRERIFSVWLYQLWPDCLRTLAIFKPDTLVRYHDRFNCQIRGRSWRFLMSAASIMSTDAQLDFTFGRTNRPIQRRVSTQAMLCPRSRVIISIG